MGSKNSGASLNFPFNQPGFRSVGTGSMGTSLATGFFPRAMTTSSPWQTSSMSLESQRSQQSGSGLAFLKPPLQPHAVLLQNEAASAEALTEDAVRFGVAGSASNPLRADFVLSGSEPALWQDFD